MATSVGDVLTPALMADLVALADGPAVRGIAVLGSAARGEASRWGAVDVESTIAGPAARWQTRAPSRGLPGVRLRGAPAGGYHVHPQEGGVARVRVPDPRRPRATLEIAP